MIPQMINEARDTIRYGYATGWAHLLAVADRVSVLAYDGRLSADDRDRIHDHLREVFGALDRLYDEGCDRLAIDDDDNDDARYHIYSDGSPVYSTVRPAGHFPSPEAAVYSGDLGPADELEPGAEVIVAWPPHLRMAEGR
jgi:hypothetical protein